MYRLKSTTMVGLPLVGLLLFDCDYMFGVHVILYYKLDGYPASLGFPMPTMHQVHAICTQSIITITHNHAIDLSNNTLRRITIPVHYFSLVIPSPPHKYPCLPCSLPSLLPFFSIRSVAPSLPAPSFLRSLTPSFLSLAPSMPRFVPSSLVPFQA